MIITSVKVHKYIAACFCLIHIGDNEWSHWKSYFIWLLWYANFWLQNEDSTDPYSLHQQLTVSSCTVQCLLSNALCLSYCTIFPDCRTTLWLWHHLHLSDLLTKRNGPGSPDIVDRGCSIVLTEWSKLYSTNTGYMSLNEENILFYALYALWKHTRL